MSETKPKKSPEAVAAELIARAKAGDIAAARIVFESVVGPPFDRVVVDAGVAVEVEAGASVKIEVSR